MDMFQSDGNSIDCDELKMQSLTLTIDGRDLKNIVNGLFILKEVGKMPQAGTCDDCNKATNKLYDELSAQLDKVEEKDW